jgi:hypothetical protein
MTDDDKQSIGYTRLDARVAGILEQRVASLEAKIDVLNAALEKTTAALSKSEKTDWPTFVAIAAVVATVVGGLGYITISPMDSRIERIENNRYSSQDAPQNVKIELIEREIERLRNKVRDGK